MIYKLLIRPICFIFNPEFIHHIVLWKLKAVSCIPGISFLIRQCFQIKNPKLQRTVFGLTFDNPVGLAAGFDKNAKYYNELNNFGFGFIEIGTVTPKPQPGNPKPRLFRLKKDEAIINRMGFNNDGVNKVVKRLRKRKNNIIIGGNIGKNKTTPNKKAVEDYMQCFEALNQYVDYFVVNVSSPNTQGLRGLQEKKPLTNILNTLHQLNNQKDKRKPILLKIAPDLSEQQLDDIIDIIKTTKTDGVIATNTTIDRAELCTSKSQVETAGAGGLSGKPLKKRSTEVIRYLSDRSNKAFPIIGVGGIHNADDAIEKLNAGADLIQIYTGFIYEGPGLIKKINKKLL